MPPQPSARSTEPAAPAGPLQPALVRDSSHPSAYASPIAGPIKLKATHASWVFLAAHDVFKVKRPIDLGFLDFRTIEARHEACEDEVRLNGRLAPGVYLGLEPVLRAPDGHHHVGGKGPVVDWAVHMRRLPDDASAAARLAAGRLGPECLEDLASTLAHFLDRAPRAVQYGTLSVLRENIDANLSQSGPFTAPGDVIDPHTLELIGRHQQQELQRHALRFMFRAEGGHIREGHGDLRLEHVYFVAGEGGGIAGAAETPMVIDCIEFDQRLRSNDVASEIALLAMELDLAERSDLSAGFVARCAEALDDFDLYGVLDFYLCHRAWVRAKLAARVTRDPAVDLAVRKRKLAEARRDFALARAFTGRAVAAPRLIAVSGVIGSGKSTLANALGRALAAPVISSDRTRKALVGLAPTERGRDDLYTPRHNEATYRELVRRAGAVLESGRTAILDATFEDDRGRQRASDLAASCGGSLVFVEASCPDWGVLRRRIAARSAAPSQPDAALALLERQVAAGKPPRLSDHPGKMVVETGRGPCEAVASALEALRRRGIAPPAASAPGSTTGAA